MKRKIFALCAIAAAISGCDVDNNENPNTLGSISLAGTPTSGETLTVSVSDPDGISSTVSYYWYADDAVIEGANESTFTLTDDYIGTQIAAQASYTDDGGINESHITDPTDEVAAIAYDSTVSITGDAVVGEELSAEVSDQNGTDDAIIAYTWYADGEAIADANLATYTVTEDELGKVITVEVSFVDDRGFDETAMSEGTEAVVRKNVEGAVTISGTPTVGNLLTAEITDEDGVSGDISYQWYADDVAISGATSDTYIVESTWIGSVLTVTVTYTDDHGFTEENTAEATIAVSAEAVDEPGSIEISGSEPYLASAALTAVITDNNGVEQENVVYTWLADGVEISGSNSATFIPTGYAGAVISVSATYTDNDGFTDTVTDSLDTIVYTSVAATSVELVDAMLSGLSDGDVVGLQTGTYTDMDELSLTSAITLRAVEDNEPVITGETCIHIADGVAGAMVPGLTFKVIDTNSGSV
ncbi:poly(beta-D-mannuronate) lyase, partial [Alteromonas sp. 14N.309.X.WAT.G.H12]